MVAFVLLLLTLVVLISISIAVVFMWFAVVVMYAVLWFLLFNVVVVHTVV